MPSDQTKVACIIPAFNEESTVASVARLAVSHPLITRVLVIDDGSNDNTAGIAQSIEGVDIIRLNPNKGKGAAMRAGIDGSSEPVLLFLDADLINLESNHITDLLNPVLSGHADMTVGLFRGGRIHTDLAHVITPSLSGQRAIRRSVIDDLDMDSTGFAIERALTELWRKKAIRVTQVTLRGVTHRTKEEKRGFLPGVKQRAKMYFEILRFESLRFLKKFFPNAGKPNSNQD